MNEIPDPHEQYLDRLNQMPVIRRLFEDLVVFDAWTSAEEITDIKQALRRNGISTLARIYLNASLFMPVWWCPFGGVHDDRGLLVKWALTGFFLIGINLILNLPGGLQILAVFLGNALLAWIYLKYLEARRN